MRGVLIPPGATAGDGLQLDRRYRLDPLVALRPERFGAMAYHYGNRRLNFLRSPLLASVVESLADHPSLQAALDALVPPAQHASYRRALSSLVASDFIHPSIEPPAPDRNGNGSDHGTYD